MRFLLAVGILLLVALTSASAYFFWKNPSLRTGSEMTLGVLVDDCHVMYLPTCQLEANTQLERQERLTSLARTYVMTTARPEIKEYVEIATTADFAHLLPGQELPEFYGGTRTSVAHMLGYASRVTQVNIQTLIMLTELSGRWWTTTGDVLSPFGATSSDTLLAQQFFRRAVEIKTAYEDTQTKTITLGDRTYRFAKDLNQGSKALYRVIASHADSPETFERIVLESRASDPMNIRSVWKALYGDDLTAINAAIEEIPELPPGDPYNPEEGVPIVTP